MKSMEQLTCCLLKEVGAQTGTSTSRDEETILARVAEEGISFLTITLPSIGKDLMVGLERGAIGRDLFVGLSRRKDSEIPKFLGGFFQLLFSDSGVLLPEAVASTVKALRQILYVDAKVDIECSPKRVALAIEQYIATDSGIRGIPITDLRQFARMSDKVFGALLTDLSNQIFSLEPRHSSGALATRESYNSRFSARLWTERLQNIFPFWDYLLSTSSEVSELDDPVTILNSAAETPSKVTTVPKTLKAPRIIAMEPVYNQMVQQGILHLLSSILRKYPHHWYGCCWEFQDFNRLLSQIGCESGKLATIDLSEASDRVSNQLIMEGLLGSPKFSFLRQVISACRSEKANVEGEIISLKKFASMGSSLTFPMETFVFYTIIHMAWEETYGVLPPHPLTPDNGVRVYGDDIIVPVSLVPSMLRLLETYGLKVNVNKSFWNGSFRESCGAEWFKGESVKPIKLKTPLPERRSHVDQIISGISFHNRLFEAGYFSTAEFVAKKLRSLIHIPAVPYGSDLLGLMTFNYDEIEWRSSPTLHRTEVKTLIARKRKPVDNLEGYGALSKFFMPHSEEIQRDANHLERDGRSQCVGLNIGWSAIS